MTLCAGKTKSAEDAGDCVLRSWSNPHGRGHPEGRIYRLAFFDPSARILAEMWYTLRRGRCAHDPSRGGLSRQGDRLNPVIRFVLVPSRVTSAMQKRGEPADLQSRCG